MNGIWAIISSIFKFISGIGTFTLGIVTVAVFTVLVVGFRNGADQGPSVSAGSVLVVEPRGFLVEQTQKVRPADVLLEDYTSGPPPETNIHELIDVIERAKDDDRIPALAISTDKMFGGAPSHLHSLAAAIQDFRLSGKPVYAISTSYSQGDYLIAAEADKIYMNPAGSVQLFGYGSYPTYFKSMLEKIGATVNVFRVGSYKAAVEPFLRDDMSPEAKENSQRFLGDLWDSYIERASAARGTEAETMKAAVNNLPDGLRAAGGDFASQALQDGLVDALLDRQSWRDELIELYGPNYSGHTFKQINWRTYQAATNGARRSGSTIAVIVARGEIVMGRGPNTVAAAETLVDYIRNARTSPNVAAIVLRVNSPGGSSFASELIRQELEAAQKAGKPVIASFGPTAASGGYWISSTADQIWAEPTTITGSIGIFGILPTFEGTLAKAGVFSDGVGTTPLAGGINPTRPLDDPIKDVVDQSVKRGYQDFLNLVASGRGMTVEDVDQVAQGQVWTGRQAYEIGLVDHLGSFNEAVAAAAEAAGVERYHVQFAAEPVDDFDQFLIDLFDSKLVRDWTGLKAKESSMDFMMHSPLGKELMLMKKTAEQLLHFNDPNGAYVLCLTCSVSY